mmetsp:Transcript_24275/g.34793  ORF Transcript_24275/g.34793 Transcript_24275/m.34793 type:complete len:83 (-) Transcript_24275:369-617(-)
MIVSTTMAHAYQQGSSVKEDVGGVVTQLHAIQVTHVKFVSQPSMDITALRTMILGTYAVKAVIHHFEKRLRVAHVTHLYTMA